MEYKAEIINGELKVKPIVIKEGNNIRIKIPSLSTITKAKKEYLKEDGKRNIQPIQS